MRTVELLRNRPRGVTLEAIARETGLTNKWLSMFGLDLINNPGANQVVLLYEYLSKRQLEII